MAKYLDPKADLTFKKIYHYYHFSRQSKLAHDNNKV